MEPEARRLPPAGVNAHFVEDRVEHLLFLRDYFGLAGHAEFNCSFLVLKVAYGALVEGAGDLVVGHPRLLVGCARHVYLRDFSVQEPILGIREGREAVLHPIFQFDVSYFVVWIASFISKLWLSLITWAICWPAPSTIPTSMSEEMCS